ncbi:MAG: zinc ribbon domain-containing protein [Peptostreptococcaceae bacterium]
MDNVQDKIGAGLSKIQDNFGKGKSKVDSIKEASRLNKIIEDTNAKKGDMLLEIGLMTYEKIRKGELIDLDIKEKCKSIVGFDYIIYESQKKISEIKREKQGFLCDCGNNLSAEDKFCGGCGKKVELPVDDNNYIVCYNCDTSIVSEYSFCPCCGVRIIR